MLIVITGSPAVGKSTLAKKLAKETGFSRLDLSKYYKDISVEYNSSKQCYDVDMKKVEKLVREKLKVEKNLIVDSHIAHLLPKKMVDLCVVVLCPNLKKLERRLKKRGYSKRKVRENLDAEIFQVCLEEAKERHKVVGSDLRKIMREIRKVNFPN
jgi:adenylate kinase